MPDPTALRLVTALLNTLEGCRLTAYQDSGGVWTIGVGCTGDLWPGTPVTAGLTITQEQADELLQQRLAPLFRMVSDKPTLAQVGYISFGFDCGGGRLQQLLAGETTISQWNKDHKGNVLDGLNHRRKLEQVLIEAAQ